MANTDIKISSLTSANTLSNTDLVLVTRINGTGNNTTNTVTISTLATAVGVAGTNVNFGAFTTDIIPATDNVYSLGNSSYQWNKLWVSSNTIYIGGVPLSTDNAGNLYVNNISVGGAGGTNLGNFTFSYDTMSLSTNNDLTIQSQAEGGAILGSFSTGYSQLQWTGDRDNQTYLWVDSSGITLENNVAQQWIFDNTGNLRFPDGTARFGPVGMGWPGIETGEGLPFSIASLYPGGNTGSSIFLGNDTAIISTTTDGAVQKQWIFDTTGSLALPDGNTIAVGIFSGTANNADYLSGNTVDDLHQYSSDFAANAYANAITDANTTSFNQAANAYANAITDANTTSFNQAANAYANAITDANTTSFNQAANAYANAVSYVNTNFAPLSGATFNGNVSVNGTATLGNTVITGSISISGNTQYFVSNNIVYSDSLIELHAPSSNVQAAWASNDGKDIGFRFHFYDGGDKNAALVLANDTKNFEFYYNGTETAGVFGSGTYANIKANAVYANLVGTANNANNLNGQSPSYYTNASNLGTGTLPYARLSANVVNTSSNFTITGQYTFNNTVFLNAISANGSVGTNGQVLTSNGTDSYWRTINTAINTSAQYAFSNNISFTEDITVGSGTTNVYANSTTISISNFVGSGEGGGVTTSSTLNATSFSGTANNSTYLNGQLASYYTNASNLSTGTLPYARLPANVVNTSSNFTITGQHTYSNSTVFSNTVSLNGLTQVQQLDMPYTRQTAANGVFTHDCSNGQIFYHTTPAASFTANFTNLGLANGYATEIKLIIVQGSSARIANAVQIGGVSANIGWLSAGGTPTGHPNNTDVMTFTIVNANTSYKVYGKLEYYNTIT